MRADAAAALGREGANAPLAGLRPIMPVTVREAIKRIEQDGWKLVRTRGSHRQYRHPERPGLVTIAGQPASTLHPKTWASIMRQAGMKRDR